MANALLEYPPLQGTPEYDMWRARVASLLKFARRREESVRTHSHSMGGPTVMPASGPAPPALTQAGPMRARAAGSVDDHVSAGSSTPSLHQEVRRIIRPQEANPQDQGDHRVHPTQDACNANPREAGRSALHYRGGCLAFTPELRRVRWPDKFRFHVLVLYDGTTDPREFLQIYSTAMVTARVDDKVMANWFP